MVGRRNQRVGPHLQICIATTMQFHRIVDVGIRSQMLLRFIRDSIPISILCRSASVQSTWPSHSRFIRDQSTICAPGLYLRDQLRVDPIPNLGCSGICRVRLADALSDKDKLTFGHVGHGLSWGHGVGHRWIVVFRRHDCHTTVVRRRDSEFRAIQLPIFVRVIEVVVDVSVEV